MSTYNATIAAGNNYAFIGFLGTNGLLTGSGLSAPATGQASGLFRLRGIKTVSNAIPETETAIITGDDTNLGEIAFDSVATRAFMATFAVNDADLASRLLGTTISTIAGAQSFEEDVVNAPVYNCVLIFQSRALNQTPGSVGNAGWESYIYHDATIQYMGRETMEERAPATYRFKITPQIARKSALGVLIDPTVHGTDGSRRARLTGEKPLHIVRFTGDGTTAAVPVDYKPISTTKTSAFVETGSGTGITQSVTVASVSATNKTVTLTNAPASGRACVIIYQFEE